MKQVVDENEENREVNRVLSSQQRYIFQKEKSMVLPERIAMECLKNMKLNIYVDQQGHKCHFKDVCISLTREVLTRERVEFEEVQSQYLIQEWENKYEDLQITPMMEDYDSGRFWAGLFIARLLKSVSDRKQLQKKSAVNISEYNYKQKYSKMLRKLEAE